MDGREKKEKLDQIYHLLLEMHNKVADSLNHLSVEKESLEDTVDAINRVKKMCAELESVLGPESEEAKARVKNFESVQKKLEKELANYSERNRSLFSSASNYAQSWNELESELGIELEKLKSRPRQPPPYIR